MNTEATKKWYGIYTRPGHERKVLESLEKKKITAYCPQNRPSRFWSERRRSPFSPLFKSTVFVHIKPEEQSQVLQIDGVQSFLFWLNKPAEIRAEEIETIMKFLAEYDNVTLEKSVVALKDKVRLINGPLIMWEGHIVEIKTNIVKITLPSLGYTLVAEIVHSGLDEATAKQLRRTAV